jgi:hypothetical protein
MQPNLIESCDLVSKKEAYICNNIPKEKKLQKNWGNNGYKVFDNIDCENMVHCILVRG